MVHSAVRSKRQAKGVSWSTGPRESTTPKRRGEPILLISPQVSGASHDKRYLNAENEYKCEGGGPNKACIIKPGTDDDWIMCDGCSQWFHICQGLTEKVLSFFASSKKAYLCRACPGDVSELFKAKSYLKELGRVVQKIQRRNEVN